MSWVSDQPLHNINIFLKFLVIVKANKHHTTWDEFEFTLASKWCPLILIKKLYFSQIFGPLERIFIKCQKRIIGLICENIARKGVL